MTLIRFTIAGTSYQAEKGMLWGDWINSGYNTDGYFISEGIITDSSGFDRVVVNDAYVFANDLINDGVSYLHRKGVPIIDGPDIL